MYIQDFSDGGDKYLVKMRRRRPIYRPSNRPQAINSWAMIVSAVDDLDALLKAEIYDGSGESIEATYVAESV